MRKELLFPDYIFESSWEVCNKVGGIYTVLSTRALTLQKKAKDKVFFIGPYFKDGALDGGIEGFEEDKKLYSEWRKKANKDGLFVKVGRWNVPGKPIAILVDFTPFYKEKDQIYNWLWESSKVDSLRAYGDYDEASMFSYAAAKVVESFYKHNISYGSRVIYHGNEWMTGLGLLYIHHRLPQIATVFTTHATSIGRSIAGNNKPLYEYLYAYNGDQMAYELNMQSKHSIEKQTAKYVDCFTTVSDITAQECLELLDKPVDVVIPNGFENSFVPKSNAYTAKRKEARAKILRVANALIGEKFDDDNTLIVSTSGRYEFRNKGIDVFIEAISRLRYRKGLGKTILALIEVPAWVKEARTELKERLFNEKNVYRTSLDRPVITHCLNNEYEDRVLDMLRFHDLNNRLGDNVKIIFVPCYLDGNDGIFNMSYYDLILGNDVCVYPSYYEPWGYTPQEAVVFGVPCITTDLAGFGIWAEQQGKVKEKGIISGVKVIHRTDYNYHEVVDTICDVISEYSNFNKNKIQTAHRSAKDLASKSLWNKFIEYYYEAYDFALRKRSLAE